jgi:hypothetical protein
MTRGVCAAVVAWGCGHAPAPVPTAQNNIVPRRDAGPDASPIDAAPLDADPEQLAARTLELWRACGHALADAHDCPEATARLDAVIDANHDVVTANAHVIHAQGHALEAYVHALAAHSDELGRASKEFIDAPVTKRCAADPAFRAAMERLRGEP